MKALYAAPGLGLEQLTTFKGYPEDGLKKLYFYVYFIMFNLYFRSWCIKVINPFEDIFSLNFVIGLYYTPAVGM